MKKNIIFIIAVIFIIIILPLNRKEQELRIRVVASSDSVYDQNVKMQVVKVLQKQISSYNQDDIIREIKKNLNDLDNEISKVLKDTSHVIELKKTRFPTKEIDGKIIPGGSYLTLLVVIDKGEGRNWWSLLYPKYHNLSFEDIENKEVEFKFYFFEKIKNILNLD